MLILRGVAFVHTLSLETFLYAPEHRICAVQNTNVASCELPEYEHPPLAMGLPHDNNTHTMQIARIAEAFTKSD